MGGSLYATDSEGEPLEDDDSVFSYGRAFFEDVKGWMIRAAIAYLEELQSKPLTKQRLIDDGMLGSALIETEPEVVVGIYEHRIQEGINLLKTWVRQRRDRSPANPSLLSGASLIQQSDDIQHMLQYHEYIKCWTKHGESVAATGYPHDSWTTDGNANYHLGPIPKRSVPVVLKRLKMAGLWRYCLCFGELEPHSCQDIAAFLNRVMPFFKEQLDSTYPRTAEELLSDVKEFTRVFELCPEDGSVVLA